MKNILNELQSREPIFHHPEKFGTTREDIENQMAPKYWEVGASGKIYTREFVIQTLLERYKNHQRKSTGNKLSPVLTASPLTLLLIIPPPLHTTHS